jgi:nucleoside-diphosphate-sugar epimerase
MRVMVFGATGETGSLIVDQALAKGHEVTVLGSCVRRSHGLFRREITTLGCVHSWPLHVCRSNRTGLVQRKDDRKCR